MKIPACVACNHVSKENCWKCRKLLKYEVAKLLRKLFGSEKSFHSEDLETLKKRCIVLLNTAKTDEQKECYGFLLKQLDNPYELIPMRKDQLIQCCLTIAEISKFRVYLSENNRNKKGRPTVVTEEINDLVKVLRSQGMGARRIAKTLKKKKKNISVSSIQRLLSPKK